MPGSGGPGKQISDPRLTNSPTHRTCRSGRPAWWSQSSRCPRRSADTCALGADQRELQSVIRFLARRRAERRFGGGSQLAGLLWPGAQITHSRMPLPATGSACEICVGQSMGSESRRVCRRRGERRCGGEVGERELVGAQACARVCRLFPSM